MHCLRTFMHQIHLEHLSTKHFLHHKSDIARKILNCLWSYKKLGQTLSYSYSTNDSVNPFHKSSLNNNINIMISKKHPKPKRHPRHRPSPPNSFRKKIYALMEFFTLPLRFLPQTYPDWVSNLQIMISTHLNKISR